MFHRQPFDSVWEAVLPACPPPLKEGPPFIFASLLLGEDLAEVLSPALVLEDCDLGSAYAEQLQSA